MKSHNSHPLDCVHVSQTKKKFQYLCAHNLFSVCVNENVCFEGLGVMWAWQHLTFPYTELQEMKSSLQLHLEAAEFTIQQLNAESNILMTVNKGRHRKDINLHQISTFQKYSLDEFLTTSPNGAFS